MGGSQRCEERGEEHLLFMLPPLHYIHDHTVSCELSWDGMGAGCTAVRLNTANPSETHRAWWQGAESCSLFLALSVGYGSY